MELKWNQALERAPMPVDLSIKRVPHHLAERLRRRAASHHRSLQGELLAMLEEHLAGDDESITLAEALELARAAGLHTPSESVEMIRADRAGQNRVSGGRIESD